VIVCSIENVDPMGVHTGDSITVAPAMTLTDRRVPAAARHGIAVHPRGRGSTPAGCNIQFAVNPSDGAVIVIEMNPRVSRSSALASKATGFPIAKIAAEAGCRLHPRRGAERHHPQDAASFEPVPRTTWS
jgi:carbamoyl-phosphate synthase large subunit